jgi:hypothetical protein
MEAFISWSGDRSRAVAEALHEWLPNVVQLVTPWIPLADIDKGTRWGTEVAVHLEACRVGLICLTPESLSAPWLLFETGALSKTLDKTFVGPYLLDLQSTDLQGLPAQFQATTTEKEETRRRLRTINTAVEDRALQASLVNAACEKWWPDLHSGRK